MSSRIDPCSIEGYDGRSQLWIHCEVRDELQGLCGDGLRRDGVNPPQRRRVPMK